MEKRETGSYEFRQKIGFWTGIPIFLIMLFLPAPHGMTPEAWKTAAVATLMVIWWITEAIPIPATALLPLALFPLLEISKAKPVAAAYGDKNIFLFLGGFLMAMTMEKWELHRRVALNIIHLLGTSPKKIILGFMVATAFLSMWISNTATTMMMLPIALAIIYHTENVRRQAGETVGKEDAFNVAMLLGIAYAASIGGIGTLVGTPPNIVFAASVKKLFPAAPEIDFFQWFLVGFPLVVVFLPIAWFYLVKFGTPIKMKNLPGGREIVRQQLKELGPLTKAERLTLFWFLVMALGWIFRRNIHMGFFTIPGWSNLLGIEKYVHDSTVAIFVSVFLFLTPVDFKKGVFLLDWEQAKGVPWGILILFGGGIALAQGFQVTGLAEWIGHSLTVLRSVPLPVMILLTALMIALLTEVTSNTAIATIFMPIMAATSIGMGHHPFLLMITATIAASLAFMLPVATPPNAIVFGAGYLTIPKMFKVGFFLDLLGVIVVTIVMYVLAIPIFGITLGQLPAWAH